MASATLGVKRHCQSCGKNFYDLNKFPIVCPHCQATFDPEVLLKSSRVKATVQPISKPVADKNEKDIDAELAEDINDNDDTIDNDEDMLDDNSDIAAITSSDMKDDEDMDMVSGDDALEDELDAPDADSEE